MKDPLEGLNEPQQQVVRTTEGPVLVLAGAGSGKTRALTHRIAYLLAQRLARAEEILAVTFTNKAAGEMRARVAGLLGQQAAVPKALGTFHGLGARILREQYRFTTRSAGFTILDESDSARVLRRAMEEARVSSKEYSIHRARAAISRAKNEQSQLILEDERLQKIYERYQALLVKADAYDFDDLLLEPTLLFEREAMAREHYRQRWQYVSVDEYQDVNALQVQWLTQLSGEAHNICVVGDDYQAIYSWRGAKVDYLLEFDQQFKECTTIYLTQNYRSTPEVLGAANAVIAENVAQKHKRLWTLRPAQGKRSVQLVAHLSDRSEARWIREQIQAGVESGGTLGDYTVLYRTNAQSRVFEEEFLTSEIPYTIVGGFRFYERREVKDALALLILTINPNSTLALARIAEALWRGVGAKTLGQWEQAAQRDNVSMWDLIRSEAARRPVLHRLTQAYAEIQGKTYATVAELLDLLLTRSGYRQWLTTQADAEERSANLEELLNVASVYGDVATFLETVALFTDLDELDRAARPGEPRPAEPGRVMCMTLHAAKGLEFDTVFVAGCEEGLLPHMNSLGSRQQLEEERRLLYVGMTRAKKNLSLHYARYRFIRGQRLVSLPSRFLSALPENVERVEAWGEGVDEETREELIDYAVPEL